MALSETYNEDNMIGMSRYPDKYFDLAICDVNYGIGEDGLKNHSRGKKAKPTLYTPKEWDKKSVDKATLDEIIRVSKNQILWGANHFISKIPYDSPAWVVWDKQNGENDFADCELAWTSFSSAVRIFKFRWAGMLQGDMKNKEDRIHPTQKPVQLYKWLLRNYAKEGDKILDTHLGSGSSRIACYDGGFDFVGFELDKEYFDAQEKRFDIFKRQLVLF
jgi:site-specific DNA-methyltransferase (adenine-specific)